MSKSTSTKRKGAESLPDPPAKKSKTTSAAETKPTKKSKVAASTTPATAPDTAAPVHPLKTKKARKTAAEFLSDDDAAKAVVDKPKVVKKSRKDKADASDAVVDQTKVTKQSEKENANAAGAAVENSKAPKKTKKGHTDAAGAVVDKPEIAEKTKTNNADDLAASRQLRAENGEPITPAAPAVITAKNFKKADQAKKPEKAEKTRKTVEATQQAAVQQVAEKVSKSKKSNAPKDDQAYANAHKKSSKMDSAEDVSDVADEIKPSKKVADKTTKLTTTNGATADDKGEPSKKMAGKTEELTTTEDTPADDGAELLKGFDSGTSDDAQDEGVDIRETPPISDPTGKIEKQLREANRKAGPDDEPGTIYIGHIPHGFFEVQMRAFFSQFGDITRIRLSRNRRTGASKHFAFIEFASAEVAKIAAKTMDGYLMFGHILKSKFAPADSLHPEVWKGANKKFHKIPHAKLEGQKLAEAKSVEQWDKKAAKEEGKRKKKAKAMKEKLGYDAPAAAVAYAKAVKKARKVEREQNSEMVL